MTGGRVRSRCSTHARYCYDHRGVSRSLRHLARRTSNKKVAAGLDVASELLEGCAIVDEAVARDRWRRPSFCSHDSGRPVSAATTQAEAVAL
jgi:hypothetical protein